MRGSAAAVALYDQALAWVRNLTATGAPVLFIDLASGETCCWCNCPDDAADSDVCDGCTEPAAAVLRTYRHYEPADVWPVCRAHRDDAVTVVEFFLVTTAQSP
jgi:hypothetical protein